MGTHASGAGKKQFSLKAALASSICYSMPCSCSHLLLSPLAVSKIYLIQHHFCVCAFVCLCVWICPLGTSLIMDGFQNDLAQLFSFMSQIAMCKFHSPRFKVKVTKARQVVLGQPSTFKIFSYV